MTRLLRRPLLTSIASMLLPITLLAAAPQALAASDREMGDAAWEEILGDKRVSRDARMNATTERVAQRIIRAAEGDPDEWEVAVLEDDTPNAFALPGGKIGVHTGLFGVVENEAQLAAVMGHEVGHLTRNHPQDRVRQNSLINLGLGILGGALDLGQGAQRLAATAATLGLVLPFSRDQELEADQVGLELMAKAGYDPREAVKVWENFERAGGNGGPEFLSTHPSPGNRGQRLQAMVEDVMPTYEQTRRQEWNNTPAPRNRGIDIREPRNTNGGGGGFDIRDR